MYRNNPPYAGDYYWKYRGKMLGQYPGVNDQQLGDVFSTVWSGIKTAGKWIGQKVGVLPPDAPTGGYSTSPPLNPAAIAAAAAEEAKRQLAYTVRQTPVAQEAARQERIAAGQQVVSLLIPAAVVGMALLKKKGKRR